MTRPVSPPISRLVNIPDQGPEPETYRRAFGVVGIKAYRGPEMSRSPWLLCDGHGAGSTGGNFPVQLDKSGPSVRASAVDLENVLAVVVELESILEALPGPDSQIVNLLVDVNAWSGTLRRLKIGLDPYPQAVVAIRQSRSPDQGGSGAERGDDGTPSSVHFRSLFYVAVSVATV